MPDHSEPDPGEITPGDGHDEPEWDDEPSDAPTGGRGRLIAIVLGVVVLLGSAVTAGVLLAPFGADERSAIEGPEGTRTFEGLPRELPDTLLPEGATDVEGTVARSGETWTAAAAYSATGRFDDLARAADLPLRDEGFELRQRAYDDTTMQVIYDRDDGATLTITYRQAGSGQQVRVAAVLIGPV